MQRAAPVQGNWIGSGDPPILEPLPPLGALRSLRIELFLEALARATVLRLFARVVFFGAIGCSLL